MSPRPTVSPAVEYDDGTAFYDEEQLRLVWAVLLARYPPMPPGRALTSAPPSGFFEQGPGLYEVGVPEASLALEYYCA